MLASVRQQPCIAHRTSPTVRHRSLDLQHQPSPRLSRRSGNRGFLWIMQSMVPGGSGRPSSKAPGLPPPFPLLLPFEPLGRLRGRRKCRKSRPPPPSSDSSKLSSSPSCGFSGSHPRDNNPGEGGEGREAGDAGGEPGDSSCSRVGEVEGDERDAAERLRRAGGELLADRLLSGSGGALCCSPAGNRMRRTGIRGLPGGNDRGCMTNIEAPSAGAPTGRFANISEAAAPFRCFRRSSGATSAVRAGRAPTGAPPTGVPDSGLAGGRRFRGRNRALDAAAGVVAVAVDPARPLPTQGAGKASCGSRGSEATLPALQASSPVQTHSPLALRAMRSMWRHLLWMVQSTVSGAPFAASGGSPEPRGAS
mmetsp:Transcript_14496/g.43239  ORF Transcript_14496/g.43239 Transcript_14496/m.43239 type:complete len:364 (-) Transcript_14496:418-1509(-)